MQIPENFDLFKMNVLTLLEPKLRVCVCVCVGGGWVVLKGLKSNCFKRTIG